MEEKYNKNALQINKINSMKKARSYKMNLQNGKCVIINFPVPVYYFLFLLSFILFFQPLNLELHAAFKDTGWSVRSAGMGGAFTAVCNDASGILYNPAGMCYLSRIELNFSYSRLFTGLDGVDIANNYIGIVLPLTKWSSSVGFTYTDIFVEQYREEIINFVYSKDITGLVKILPNISAGINFKLLRINYYLDKRTREDPVFLKDNKNQCLSFDIGFWSGYYLDKVSFALVVKNINEPDIGLRTKDIVPAEIKVGIEYYWNENILTAVDISYRNQSWGKDIDKFNFCIGNEVWFLKKIFGLRAGINFNEISTGGSIRLIDKLNFAAELEYAFLFPLEIQNTSGTHKAGLKVRF